MMHKIVILVCLAFFLAGCTGKGSEPMLESGKAENLYKLPTLGEYAKARRMSERSQDRQREAYNAFVTRNKVADYVAKQILSDDAEIRIRILDERNRILLQKYFDNYTNQQVNDKSIEAYYQDNQDKFFHHSYKVEYALVKHHKIKEGDEIAGVLETVREAFEAGEVLSTISPPENVELGELSVESETSDRAIVNALVGLDVNAVTQVVITNRGMQVFRIVEKVSTPRSLDEVRDAIRYELAQQFKATELARLESLVN